MHGPFLEASLRRYEGGTHGQGFFKEGGTKGGRGSREGGEDRGGSGWGAQPRSSHLVSVEEERIGENSTLRDLSPISVEPANKGQGKYTAERHTINNQNKQTGKCQQPKDMIASPLHPL